MIKITIQRTPRIEKLIDVAKQILEPSAVDQWKSDQPPKESPLVSATKQRLNNLKHLAADGLTAVSTNLGTFANNLKK